MCGIVGKLHWQPILDNNPVYKMSERLIHRGPDEMGSLVLEKYHLDLAFHFRPIKKSKPTNLFPNRINEMIGWSLKEPILFWEWGYNV